MMDHAQKNNEREVSRIANQIQGTTQKHEKMFNLHDEAIGANSQRLLYLLQIDKKIADLDHKKADKTQI